MVGTWHAWTHPWLLYHFDSGVILGVENLWCLVLPPIALNDPVWFSSPWACPNGQWKVVAYGRNQTWDGGINSLESDGQTPEVIKDGAHIAPNLQFVRMMFTTLISCGAIFYYPFLWIGIGPSYLARLHSQLRGTCRGVFLMCDLLCFSVVC